MNHILIIDNSYSMIQKTGNRLSYFEIAKKFAETYITTRVKMPETKADKYLIFSTQTDRPQPNSASAPPNNSNQPQSQIPFRKALRDFVRVNDLQFILEDLRSIDISYSTDTFYALKTTLEFIDAFRMVSQADNYYGGRDVLKAENSNVGSFRFISDLHCL